jgi:hypothetical protein
MTNVSRRLKRGAAGEVRERRTMSSLSCRRLKKVTPSTAHSRSLAGPTYERRFSTAGVWRSHAAKAGFFLRQTTIFGEFVCPWLQARIEVARR